MLRLKQNAWKIIGAIGTLLCLILFIREPSFPTPDKLVIFLSFVFMMFSQAVVMLKRLLPFVAILLVYESFRGIADSLNQHVHYSLMPRFDEWLFGNLPTVYLQNWWWHGHVAWYDLVFYLPYLLFFILPIALALLIWKIREKHYWRFVTTFLAVSFMAFITFLLFPAAPPWLASDLGYIQQVTRISSNVWSSLGLSDFPSIYDQVSPNSVAAVPSLHAAWATLVAIFVYKLFGKKWGLLAAVYPLIIYVGTIYQGEHYAFDAILGIVYAVVAYLLTPRLLRAVIRGYKYTSKRWSLLNSN